MRRALNTCAEVMTMPKLRADVENSVADGFTIDIGGEVELPAELIGEARPGNHHRLTGDRDLRYVEVAERLGRVTVDHRSQHLERAGAPAPGLPRHRGPRTSTSRSAA